MYINLKCKDNNCNFNEGKVCKYEFEIGSKKEMPCNKDVFQCQRCGYMEMLEDPLLTKRCPSCRVISWDIDKVICNHCSYEWYPRNYHTKTCPKCSKRLIRL